MKQQSPIWSLGFRPFFFAGSVYSLFLILYWTAVQSGLLTWSLPINPIYWHAHEMLYGFSTAITAGFILTASQNWSGIRGVHGTNLKVLFFVWCLARALSLMAPHTLLFPLIDLFFYPLLIYFLKPYLSIPSQKRNQIFFIFFVILFLSNVSFHISNIYDLNWQRASLHTALHTIIAIIVVIGGRVIPFFTQNAVPGAQLKKLDWVERALLPSLAFFGIAYLYDTQSLIFAIAAAIAFSLQLIRMMLWRPWQSFSKPILAILYMGYFWIPVGFILYSLSFFSLVPPSLAAHSFGLGAIGTLIYGMITRVSLGHTARPIRANPFIIVGYGCITAAAAMRVGLPSVLPSFTFIGVQLSGILWGVAFFILVVSYTNIWLKPRLDGAEG